ncbi:AbiV family abortive infection protein [Rhizobium sp.]
MTEEEIVAWLTRNRPPIRREGVMSQGEVAAAVTAYLANGLSLLEESLLLSQHGRQARAASLVILGLEEIAKVPLLVNTFLSFEHGVDKEAWKAYWKSGGSHRTKQALILGYGNIIRGKIEGDPVSSRRLYRNFAPESVLEAMDTFKQSNFYVDLRKDGIHAPIDDEKTLASFDYLLAFGQERGDSFCSWHVSARRSLDFLDLALGRKTVSRWTSHYSVPEVRADILYQMMALSASIIPDYSTFFDFMEQYKKKVSDKHLKEALLTLAQNVRSRVDHTVALPISHTRHLNALKLLIGLSKGMLERKHLLGTTFSKKLESVLLPEKEVQSESHHSSDS